MEKSSDSKKYVKGRKSEMIKSDKYTYITLRQNPQLKEEAAA